jgi:hypothetical protein
VRCPILNRDEQKAVAGESRSDSALRLPALTIAPGLRRALPGVLFALLVVGAYADPLFFRRNFSGRDLLGYMLPIEKSIHDAYARGRLPVWIPEISGGRPLAANPNVGALYPVRILQAVLPYPLAMRTFPVIHWILAGWGMILLLRSLGTSPAGSFLGAVTYAFSAVSVAEVFFPNIQPGMALLPWILWASARSFARQSTKLFLLSLLYGVDFLAGDVFTIGIAIVSSALWIVLETDQRERSKELLLLAAALALAAVLAAPQILATALWIPHTNRAVLGMKVEESLSFFVHPLRLLELVIPFPFGSTWTLESWTIWAPSVFHGRKMGFFGAFYSGALAVIGLVTTWRMRMPGARFARVLFFLSIVVMIAPGLVFTRYGRVASPLPLRYPEKFAVGLTLTLALLAAFGFDRHLGVARGTRWPLFVAGLLAALAGTAALFPKSTGRLAVHLVGSDSGFPAVAANRLPGSLTEGALLWIATVVALDLLSRPSPVVLIVSVAIITLVPIAANRKIARTIPEEQVFLPSSFARFLRRTDPANQYRTLGVGLYEPLSRITVMKAAAEPEEGGEDWTQFRQALAGRGTVLNADFDAGDFARVDVLRKLVVFAGRYPDPKPFFQNLSLRWAIRFSDQQPVRGYQRIGGNWAEEWDELRGSLPDIRLAQLWREEIGAMRALQELPTLRTGELIIESGRRSRGTARSGFVEVLEKTPERLFLRTQAPDESWLFVLRGFWNYRSVRMDGQLVECSPAQLGFSAVPVPAGTHTIEWREELPGWEISRWGPLLFTLLTLFYLSRERRLRRERVATGIRS